MKLDQVSTYIDNLVPNLPRKNGKLESHIHYHSNMRAMIHDLIAESRNNEYQKKQIALYELTFMKLDALVDHCRYSPDGKVNSEWITDQVCNLLSEAEQNIDILREYKYE